MKMVEACQWAAGEHGCDVDVEISENFRGYRVKPASKALAIGRGALEACGIEPIERNTGGGSDANAFRVRGFDALLARQRDQAQPHLGRVGDARRARSDARRLPRGGRRGRQGLTCSSSGAE